MDVMKTVLLAFVAFAMCSLAEAANHGLNLRGHRANRPHTFLQKQPHDADDLDGYEYGDREV
eukprot:CAMPEP_0170298214 /NCGR_PEP_ID=MMETSP0116_2-20130129/49281_1 /TAXON_ID=400756 /ORGANISM="Durinskia baltica, Strain CSIRO CS-38" /LENGTH=61 /DNA_ID=CAMNT_0010549865 /DNA_START=68 /DNA_END=250 /DNA_ORIENTATION=+